MIKMVNFKTTKQPLKVEVTAAGCWHCTVGGDGAVWLVGPLVTYINPSSFMGLFHGTVHLKYRWKDVYRLDLHS